MRGADSFCHVPWQGTLAGLRPPGNGEVDWKKADHAPLLLIGGGSHHIVPPAVPTAVLEKYNYGGGGLVEYKQFEGGRTTS